MDGNGRWARRRGKARAVRHRAGIAAMRRVVKRAPDLSIRCLTLYAFSSDNWTRPADEVQSIFGLMRAFLRIETQRLRQRGARLPVVGWRDRIPAPLRREIEKAEFETAGGIYLRLRIAVDYSPRDAITRAAAAAIHSLQEKLPVSPELLRGTVTDTLMDGVR